MGTRWWRSEHLLRVVDTNGNPVEVFVGVVRDQHGRWQRGVAIGDGPSALFTITQTSALIRALEQSTKDLFGLEGVW